jgi:hypothetical protein
MLKENISSASLQAVVVHFQLVPREPSDLTGVDPGHPEVSYVWFLFLVRCYYPPAITKTGPFCPPRRCAAHYLLGSLPHARARRPARRHAVEEAAVHREDSPVSGIGGAAAAASASSPNTAYARHSLGCNRSSAPEGPDPPA